MTPVKLLREARDLIADPNRWTQGYFARDGKGEEVATYDGGACRWCAVGALYVVAARDPEIPDAVCKKTIDLLSSVAYMPITDYNDSHTHSEVMSVYSHAIGLGMVTGLDQ